MAGQKFGTTRAPRHTWAHERDLPALVAERYAASRIVVFSTGNVYPLAPGDAGGAAEDGPTGARRRVRHQLPGTRADLRARRRAGARRCSLIRLNYAVELRYGVLLDIARQVRSGAAGRRSRMGYVNVIWQGDANDRALRAWRSPRRPPACSTSPARRRCAVRWLARALRRAIRHGAPVRGNRGARRAAQQRGPAQPDSSAPGGLGRDADRLDRGLGGGRRPHPRQADPLRGPGRQF